MINVSKNDPQILWPNSRKKIFFFLCDKLKWSVLEPLTISKYRTSQVPRPSANGANTILGIIKSL